MMFSRSLCLVLGLLVFGGADAWCAEGRVYRLWGGKVQFVRPPGSVLERNDNAKVTVRFPDSNVRVDEDTSVDNESVSIERRPFNARIQVNRRLLRRELQNEASGLTGYRLEMLKLRGRRVDYRYSHDSSIGVAGFERERSEGRAYLRNRQVYFASVFGFESRWDDPSLRRLRQVVETFKAR